MDCPSIPYLLCYDVQMVIVKIYIIIRLGIITDYEELEDGYDY